MAVMLCKTIKLFIFYNPKDNIFYFMHQYHVIGYSYTFLIFIKKMIRQYEIYEQLNNARTYFKVRVFVKYRLLKYYIKYN